MNKTLNLQKQGWEVAVIHVVDVGHVAVGAAVPVLGVELLAGLEPGEGGLLAGVNLSLASLQQSEDILGI